MSAPERIWTKWSDKRAPNQRGTFRYRVTADILGATVSPEWSEEMSLCGMGYSESEWWPLALCHWDGYRRRITHDELEWSHPQEDDAPGVTWHGLNLLPCPFSGRSPVIKAEGRYIGAPLWHSEALWISSGVIKPMRFVNAKEMIRVWNTRADLVAALEAEKTKAEAERDEARRRRDEWKKKAEGFDAVCAALREKVGAPWPPHLSRVMWAGLAAAEKARADRAEAERDKLRGDYDAAEELNDKLEAALQETERQRQDMHRRAQKAEGLLERMARFLNTLERWARTRKDYEGRRYIAAAARHVRGRTGIALGLLWACDWREREALEAENARLRQVLQRIAATSQAMSADYICNGGESGHERTARIAFAALTPETDNE